ncbi:MAG: SGNH/GDSL hydrolase family protein, partial [Cyanobacteriota bacterium]|nr:SGNH/GDSL hydrolase family protein [Cyanobacteriota bacterium]
MINQNCQTITNNSLLKEISPQYASQNSFTSFITFGDSLADVGNLFITTRSINPNPPSPPYADGRFSNGELVPEIIAKELGLSASTPSLAGGDNYAFGTAETGSGFSDEGLPNVGEQIKTYLDIDAPAEGDIFFISAGSNNFFPDIDEEITPDNIAAPATVLEGLTENITTLADAGAESFIIPNLALLGTVPYAKEGGISDALNSASTEFNSLLDTKLDNLSEELGINIIELDVASEIARIRANPEDFGLVNIEEPALNKDNEIVVPNPNQYFWWDEFHATTLVSNLVAQAVIDEIPKDTVKFKNSNTFSLGSYFKNSFTASFEENSNYSSFSLINTNEYLHEFVMGNTTNLSLENESSKSLASSKLE